MADEEQPQQHGRDVKLPTFWKARQEAWFVYAESKFRLKHVDTEQEQSDHLLAALSEEVLAQVMDVIEDLPEDTPYTTLSICWRRTPSPTSRSWSSSSSWGS
jgi:hypothetical protein